jgi:hypothetical protein
MGLKSAYREKPVKVIPEQIPATEKFTTEPVADAIIRHEADKPPDVAADEATLRLQRQIQELKQSEELQRQAAAAQPQVSPEWRAFLEANPRLQQNFHLAYAAASQAHNEGHQVNSRAQMERTLELVDQHLRQMHREAPTPEFFAPPPPPSPEPDRSSHYSAPVSREVHSGNGTRRELSPSQVRLSPQQREAAAMAGISEVEYAKRLSKLGAYKASRGVEHE